MFPTQFKNSVANYFDMAVLFKDAAVVIVLVKTMIANKNSMMNSCKDLKNPAVKTTDLNTHFRDVVLEGVTTEKPTFFADDIVLKKILGLPSST